MERVLNRTMNAEKESTNHCVEEGRWPQTLDFDGNDEELGAFYEHAEVCPLHKEIVIDANSTFQMSLLRFNCQLKADQKPKYSGRVHFSFGGGESYYADDLSRSAGGHIQED
jgi:hypothetical protein